jgi:hypothetical protein
VVPLVFKTSLGAVRFPEGSTPSLLRQASCINSNSYDFHVVASRGRTTLTSKKIPKYQNQPLSNLRWKDLPTIRKKDSYRLVDEKLYFLLSGA